MCSLRGAWWLLAGLAISCGTRSLDAGDGSGGQGGSAAAIDAGGDALDAPVEKPPIVIVERDFCGDGVRGGAEECDDHNRTSGDGCSAVCQVECYSSCGRCGPPGTCLTSTPHCGDGRVDSGERCDDGNAVPGDGCDDSCRILETGWTCPVVGARCLPTCGDGMIVGSETCDDGGTLGGDGCSEICLVEPSAARCGDGVVSGAEECDLGAGNDDAVYGGCTTRCRLAAHCGDAIVNGPEQCDDGTWMNVVTYGNKDGCTFACKFPAFCGDEILDSDEGEQCDFGAINGDGTWRCTRECKVPLD